MPQAEDMVGYLRAAGEITRLRLLCLLLDGELSVKDCTEILDQSQPRVSRHLKLLVDAGVINRHAEGAWAYFRLADKGAAKALLDWIGQWSDFDSPELAADRVKLIALREHQREWANAFFAKIADEWDQLRSLHVDDADIEAAILKLIGVRKVEFMLDLGTGTGRMLELLAAHYNAAVGIDSSREMLAIARSKLDAAGASQAQVRLGDITQLQEADASADLVVIHQVLHYFDDPSLVLDEVARVLKPNGEVFVVDFAPHDKEFLRDEQAHRRLGLSEEQMLIWSKAVGLSVVSVEAFLPKTADGISVCLWRLTKNS